MSKTRNEAIRELADIARDAIANVAAANYRWREDEALARIDEAEARLLRKEAP